MTCLVMYLFNRIIYNKVINFAISIVIFIIGFTSFVSSIRWPFPMMLPLLRVHLLLAFFVSLLNQTSYTF